MTVAFSPLSTQPVFYNGKAVIGAKVYVYETGTNTPKTAFLDGQELAEHEWPFLTDSDGTIPPFWVNGTSFKVKITTSEGRVIRTIDNVNSVGVPTISPTPEPVPGEGTVIPTGYMIPAHRTGVVEGWVRANGRSIGPEGSGATERANEDTFDLFKVLWDNDPMLYVLGGRGVSAADDFALGKTIDLPDYRGRTLVGLADMGGPLSTRLDSVVFANGTKSTLGSSGGAANITLTTEQIPAHTHTGSSGSSGAHTHSGSASSSGIHSHTNSVDTAGSHLHTGSTSNAGTHNHTASANTGGGHSHSGTSDSNGSHTHAVTDSGHNHGYQAITYVNLSGAAVGTGFRNGDFRTSTEYSNISIQSGGLHSHNISINSAGDHVHTVTVNSGGDHSHSFSMATAGSHSHTVMIDDNGSHTHTITTESAGAHTHTITNTNTGGGLAHSNMQPFYTTTIYIKL